MRVKVIGQPDRLNVADNEVWELKTYRYSCNRDRQLVAGQFQAMFYCWLTGLNDYQVHLYNAVSRRMEEKIEGHFNLRVLRKQIDWAIELQNLALIRSRAAMAALQAAQVA